MRIEQVGGVTIVEGDATAGLRLLDDQSVNCCVTSPPYWGLRDYGVAGQLGLEPTPAEYVERMVAVFREVRRVLRDDGTIWINLGDSYYGGKGQNGSSKARATAEERGYTQSGGTVQMATRPSDMPIAGLKPKDLVGIPWRVAFALQADGWWLRSDIIWSKPNVMPSSVKDRCTTSHEYIFMLSKSAKYYYDADAIAEPAQEWTGQAATFKRDSGKATVLRAPGQSKPSHRADRKQDNTGNRTYTGFNDRYDDMNPPKTRNKRSVWTVTTKPFKEAHFATFPPDLIEPCVLAGCPVGGVVLDPFSGAGTTGLVAQRHGRQAILLELNPKYVDMTADRIKKELA